MGTPLAAIPDHLQEEIFLRLPTAADLARASAACVSFRRLATGRSFLRRFRRHHAPPLLGFLQRDHFFPALPPHHSAPAARALALAADFSFSFLPSHCRWIVQDVRDGRVLLGRRFEKDDRPPLFRELAVCDPLQVVRNWGKQDASPVSLVQVCYNTRCLDLAESSSDQLSELK